MEDFLWQMDVFELKWLEMEYNPKFHRRIITRRRKYLSLVLAFIVNEFVVPLIKMNFYVTEKHKEANRIFYYRKPLWTLISKLALQKFS
jgi:telomerase reverse transcriptase